MVEESTARARRKNKRKSRWSDLPLSGDESSHICVEPLVIYASFVLFMISFGYFLYAIFMPVEAMTS